MAVNKNTLLSVRTSEEEIEVPGVGTVRIRALTRAEALEVQGKDMSVSEMEQKLLSAALLEPELSAKEVAMWQKNAPAGELEPVVAAIVRLSGLKVDSPKEAMKNFRG